VHGVASLTDLKKLGRVGLKALFYFEVVSTFALIIGLVVVNLIRPGEGFNIDPKTLDPTITQSYVQAARDLSTQNFLLNIIPSTFFSAFISGEILQVLFVALLSALAILFMKERGAPLLLAVDHANQMFFGIMRMVVRLAPIGAFGAMAFTIGAYGVGALNRLVALMGAFYITALLFVIMVLGLILRSCGLSIFRFLAYIKDELLLVLGTS
jgi:aerobic C4-dicarboxylate transport protein